MLPPHQIDPSARTQIFRPHRKVVLGRVVLPGIFLFVLGFTGLNLVGGATALGWLLLTLIPTLGVVAVIYAIPVLLGRVTVEPHELSLTVDGMHMRFGWHEVRAIQLRREDGVPNLVLGVASGLYILPLHHFDSSAVWAAVQQVAPAEIVCPEALLPYERLDAGEGISPRLFLVGNLRVADRWGLLAAGGLGASGFFLLFCIALITGQPGGLLFLSSCILYVLVLTGIGTTEMDMLGITRRTMLGVTRISWDELEAVEFGPFGLRIVLEGTLGRRLVLYGPSMWTGADASRAAHFLALQISTRRLSRRRSAVVLLKMSRNTRI